MILFWISVGTLVYVYIGYFLCLKCLCRLAGTRPEPVGQPGEGQGSPDYPAISVIIAAFNEEKTIAGRIKDLLAQSYPGQMEIIVASDGSGDRTVAVSRRFPGVRVLDFKENRGRAMVHNDAVAAARGDIIVATDAETRFAPGFLTRITAPFRDDAVGCTVGMLRFRDKDSGIARAEGLYWKWEVRTRICQDRLGLLMTGTGACTAFRRELFTPLRPVDDIDFATTIDVILAGRQIRYVTGAVAWDEAPGTLKAEMNGRIRSSKRLLGTLGRWGLVNWVARPLYTWTLVSHKLLRWASPFFILAAFFANIGLLGTPFYDLSFALMILAGMLAAAGSLEHARFYDFRIPLASVFFSFFMANLGFLLGFARLVTGRVPIAYKVTEGSSTYDSLTGHIRGSDPDPRT